MKAFIRDSLPTERDIIAIFNMKNGIGEHGTSLATQVLSHLFLIFISFGFPLNEEVINIVKLIINHRKQKLPLDQTWYEFAKKNFRSQSELYRKNMTWAIVKRQLQNPDFRNSLTELGPCIKDGLTNSQVWSLQVAYKDITKFPTTKEIDQKQKKVKSTNSSKQYETIMECLSKVDSFNRHIETFA